MTEPSPVATRSTSDTAVVNSAKPYRGERISWADFRKLMADVANDNAKRES